MAIAGLYDFTKPWHEQGTVYITSDTHFNDLELAEGIKNRPSANDLVRLINSKVGYKDTLIHLGDIGDLEYVRKLRGYKILITGNHDAGISNYKRDTVTKIYDDAEYTREEARADMQAAHPDWKIIVQDWCDFCKPYTGWKVIADNGLFDEIYRGPLFISDRLVLSHEPLPQVSFAYNIHGHIHNQKNLDDYHKNVCLDVTDYQVLNLNQFIKSGALAKIPSIHRETINKATAREKGDKIV